MGLINKLTETMTKEYPFSCLGTSLYTVLSACEYVTEPFDYYLQDNKKLLLPIIGFATDLYFKTKKER